MNLWFQKQGGSQRNKELSQTLGEFSLHFLPVLMEPWEATFLSELLFLICKMGTVTHPVLLTGLLGSSNEVKDVHVLGTARLGGFWCSHCVRHRAWVSRLSRVQGHGGDISRMWSIRGEGPHRVGCADHVRAVCSQGKCRGPFAGRAFPSPIHAEKCSESKCRNISERIRNMEKLRHLRREILGRSSGLILWRIQIARWSRANTNGTILSL